MRQILSILLLILPGWAYSQVLSNTTNINIIKTWDQEPNGWAYPMSIHVPEGDVPAGGFPVCILLHGNGGNGAGTITQFENLLDCHALVAPTGYMNSWNICSEDSEAPDLEMIEDLAIQLQTYTNINPNQIRVLGTSNGAALANNVFINNTNTGIDAITAIVSQLSDVQFHMGDFYKASGETSSSSPFCGYDQIASPISGRKYLSICNENDGVIPYTGGPSSVGINFLPAQAAAHIIALNQGHSGGQVPDPGTQIDTSNVYEYSYLSGQVVLLRGDAGHGTNTTQINYIKDFLGNCSTPPIYGCTDPTADNYAPNANTDDGSCTYSSDILTNTTNINITKTWYQEPSGWTYPMSISVPSGAPPENGFPLCVLLHGNGGNGGGMVNAWSSYLDSHILVAPSGYENSWNISDENSEAPDIEMIEELILQLQTYSNVNPNKIRVLGTSNGSALSNRVLIENINPGIDIICGIVSQLSEAQYHNDHFHYPSGDTGGTDTYDGYDIKTTPVSGRKYLNICNENDMLIPYTGGPSLGVNFLDAQLAAYIVAQSQGYTGSQLQGNGTQIGTSSNYEYAYLSGQVVHIRGNAGHGTDTTQKEYVSNFFQSTNNTPTLYVDYTATGSNDGSSWSNAFNDLQDALAIGSNSDILIAEGIYYPTSTTSRGIAFEIPTGATLIGGYPNGGGFSDPETHETILSGNIDGVSSYDGNSYHVVIVRDVDDVTLEGISIRDGNANDANSFGRARGGGLFVNNATLTLNDVTVKWNKGIYGAGMFATLSDYVSIHGSTFKKNEGDYGSAIYHSNQTQLYIHKTRIIDNTSLIRVAIEVNNSLFTRIENSVIANNASTNANAIGFISTNRDGLAEIVNCTILGETLNKNLITLQIGFGDQLDVTIDNSIIAHQEQNFTRAIKEYNNGILNLNTNHCYVQGSSVIGTSHNNIYSDIEGALSLDTNYALLPCSPGIDAGSNSLTIGTKDIGGNPRVSNTNVDMGAYENDMACRLAITPEQEKQNSNISIYPNPTRDRLFIETDIEKPSVLLYDILGQNILSTHQKELDISSLPKGMYWIKIMDKNTFVTTIKIVKE